MPRWSFSIFATNLDNFPPIETVNNFMHFSWWNRPSIRVEIIKMCLRISSIFRWPIGRTAMFSSPMMHSIQLWIMRMEWNNGRKRRFLRNYKNIFEINWWQIDRKISLKSKLALQFVSNCQTNSKREKLIEELKQHISLTEMGQCSGRPECHGECYEKMIGNQKL